MNHYYSEKQTSEFKLSKINDIVRKIDIELFTAPGVFSTKKIDYGTRLLAEKMIIADNDKVLDFGCGLGIIGIIAAHLTKNKVVLIDVNTRACKLAKMNTKSLKNIEVFKSNFYENLNDRKFNVIVLNPPHTAGKDICFQMIEESKEHLEKNGSLQIVARHNKGGKVLSEKMEAVFGNIDTITKKGGYRVYLSKNL
jgi:16S rRNA (guanine1207-N2)-methyltransferase